MLHTFHHIQPFKWESSDCIAMVWGGANCLWWGYRIRKTMVADIMIIYCLLQNRYCSRRMIAPAVSQLVFCYATHKVWNKSQIKGELPCGKPPQFDLRSFKWGSPALPLRWDYSVDFLCLYLTRGRPEFASFFLLAWSLFDLPLLKNLS